MKSPTNLAVLALALASAIQPDDIAPGEVFKLTTMSLDGSSPGIDNAVVNVYVPEMNLGIAPGHEFHGILLPEYNLLLQPEPLMAVKIASDSGQLYLNSSMFRVPRAFGLDNWRLDTGSKLYVCPSMNYAIVSNNNCPDPVPVQLEVWPVY